MFLLYISRRYENEIKVILFSVQCRPGCQFVTMYLIAQFLLRMLCNQADTSAHAWIAPIYHTNYRQAIKPANIRRVAQTSILLISNISFISKKLKTHLNGCKFD